MVERERERVGMVMIVMTALWCWSHPLVRERGGDIEARGLAGLGPSWLGTSIYRGKDKVGLGSCFLWVLARVVYC